MDDTRRPYSRQPSSTNINTSTTDRATDLLDLQRLQGEQSQYIHSQQPGVPQLPQLPPPPPPTTYAREYAPRDYLQQQQQYQQDQQRQIQYQQHQHQQERDRDQEQRQLQQQLQQQQEQQQQQQTIKRERERERLPTLNMSYAKDEGQTRAGVSTRSGTAPAAREDPMPSTSDFVKKLYKMLEDPAFQPVVCWGPLGDCFVVKDMNEFTKSILPRMFKHSNFASFVRQLNKYDFHKVKNTDDNQFGEHSWTFRHPDFHADRRDALENIKRKVPAQRKAAAAKQTATTNTTSASASSNHQPYPSQSPGPSSYHHGRGRSHGGHGRGGGGTYTRSPSPESPYASSGGHAGHHASSHHHRDHHAGAGGSGGNSNSNSNSNSSSSQAQINSLTSEVARLKDESDELRARIRGLERNYESVLLEIVGFQRGMKQQDGIVQSLIGLVLDGSGGGAAGAGGNLGGTGGIGKGA
ncbi:hypothetical protein D9619_012941 [Psilocybe cf. subviscida]|uniref:HSF-type DNA-binding domain-containing protein n=1 Tax=Psilocybe cf. subviscida TaxID=2480587 RepID=A0A8H5BJ51_9AGAR|nr:hypothetical protein D9619_012941 [Psilocybe cf. subviscida]